MAARLRGRPLASVVAIGIGHNNGPPMATRWGLHCWRRAQAEAWKAPALEVVRLRLRRAAELGLSYRHYASILMEAGRSPTAIVFGLSASPAPGAAERLRGLDRPRLLAVAVDCDRDGLVDDRLRRFAEAAGDRIAGWRSVPGPAALSGAVLDLLAGQAVPTRAALMVGASDAERDAATRARLGAFLHADAYFRLPTAGPSP